MKTKFSIIFGTRPEYLKLKSLIDEFKKHNIDHKVIYILQHENINEVTDSLNFEFVKIDNVTESRLNNIGSNILNKLPEIIKDSQYIIVQGDTAAAFYSSLSAFQLGKKIIHIEAGLRTYDLNRPFPEEGYRQMISRITSIHFTPHEDCNKILNNEKVSGICYSVGNTILDLVSSYNLTVSMDNIVLITFHRRENWDKISFLMEGLYKLIDKTPNIKYLWYLHPNPDLQNQVKNSIKNLTSIELKNPSNHIEFTKELARSNFIITDSGGIQEEASFLGKHCIVLRNSTERNHIPKEYITVLQDYTKLDEIYEEIPKEHLPICEVYGKGESAKKIVENLASII